MVNDKKLKEAKEELAEAFKVLPDSKEANDLLLQIEIAEKINKAKDVLEQTFLDFEAGKETEAKQKLEESKVIDPEVLSKTEGEYLKQAEALIKDKKYEEAKKIIGRILFINPDNSFAQELFQLLQSIMEFVK